MNLPQKSENPPVEGSYGESRFYSEQLSHIQSWQLSQEIHPNTPTSLKLYYKCSDLYSSLPRVRIMWENYYKDFKGKQTYDMAPMGGRISTFGWTSEKQFNVLEPYSIAMSLVHRTNVHFSTLT